MPGKQKSEWSKTLAELKAKAQLPKKVDARNFRNCRVDGVLDKALVTKVCEEKGCKDKADAIYAFLKHLTEKPAGPMDDGQGAEEAKLLSKSTYKKLTFEDFEKLIPMLTKMQSDCIDEEMAKAESIKGEQDEKIKLFKARKAAMGKK